MEDYKPNSYKSREREEKKKELPEKRRTEKVVSGQVKVKKKNGVSKFLSFFIPEDVDDAKAYILQDVVVPAAKDIIMDTISALLGINNRYRSNKRSPGATVPCGDNKYSTCYDCPNWKEGDGCGNGYKIKENYMNKPEAA